MIKEKTARARVIIIVDWLEACYRLFPDRWCSIICLYHIRIAKPSKLKHKVTRKYLLITNAFSNSINKLQFTKSYFYLRGRERERERESSLVRYISTFEWKNNLSRFGWISSGLDRYFVGAIVYRWFSLLQKHRVRLLPPENNGRYRMRSPRRSSTGVRWDGSLIILRHPRAYAFFSSRGDSPTAVDPLRELESEFPTFGSRRDWLYQHND